MMTAEESVLKLMVAVGKLKAVKIPEWFRIESRPNEKAIIPWEIYGKAGTVFSEHDVVCALQELRKKNMVEIILKNGTIWWVLKT